MDEFFEEFVSGIRVRERLIPVPYNYRISYKVTELLLIIFYCCRRTSGCSIEKINVISNAIINKFELDKLMNFINGKRTELILIQFNPIISRAITYALAEKMIIIQKNGNYKLTDKGYYFAQVVSNENEIFISEKNIMKQISRKLTEKKIKDLMSDWRFNNVED